MSDAWYWQRADEIYGRPRSDWDKAALEVFQHGHVVRAVGTVRPQLHRDVLPTVSKGTSPGAWVMAWVWIPDPTHVEGEEDGKEGNHGETGS
jgi:hypothetical protein